MGQVANRFGWQRPETLTSALWMRGRPSRDRLIGQCNRAEKRRTIPHVGVRFQSARASRKYRTMPDTFPVANFAISAVSHCCVTASIVRTTIRSRETPYFRRLAEIPGYSEKLRAMSQTLSLGARSKTCLRPSPNGGPREPADSGATATGAIAERSAARSEGISAGVSQSESRICKPPQFRRDKIRRDGAPWRKYEDLADGTESATFGDSRLGVGDVRFVRNVALGCTQRGKTS